MVALDSHRNVNPTVNCACEGSRLCPPYESHPEAICHLLLPLDSGKVVSTSAWMVLEVWVLMSLS